MSVCAASDLPKLPAGKPGLYEFRGATNGAVFRGHGAGNLPEKELQQLADAALAQSVPMFQICVPQGGAKELDPANLLIGECTFSNIVSRRTGYTADASCRVGAPNDITHLTVDDGTPDHRTVTLSLPLAGTPFSLITRYEITRLSADCGAIPPGALRMPDGKIRMPSNP